jgi:predicted nicotinamide N-methyase
VSKICDRANGPTLLKRRAPWTEREVAEFIRAHLPLTPVPSIPEIRLHRATASSGLWRLAQSAGGEFGTPYWAYPWAGGLALARHILNQPEIVTGRRILDLGAGSGLVGIAAAKGAAEQVFAADIDRHAIVALGLNAAANDVSLTGIHGDAIEGPVPDVDLILVGDLFYDAALAARVTTFLDASMTAGVEILVGDLGRAFLPLSRLTLLAEYSVADFGDAGNATRPGMVFSFR